MAEPTQPIFLRDAVIESGGFAYRCRRRMQYVTSGRSVRRLPGHRPDGNENYGVLNHGTPAASAAS